MTALERWRRDPGLVLVVLAMLAAVVLYAPTLGRGLVSYDDPWLVRDNWLVRDASWSSLRTIFFDLDVAHRFTLTPEYLPIRDLSVMADYALWGDWYGGFHLTNLVLYLAAIPLWFAALESFGVDRTIAGLTLLVWAVLPCHAESVAWVAERKGVLGMMFAGACALGHARFRAGGPPRWLVLAVVCGVCAVWSKALAAFALAAIAGLELVLPDRRVSWRRSLGGLGAIAGVAGLAFVPVIVLAASSSVVGLEMQAPGGRGAMAIGTFGFYLRLGLATVRDAVSYPIATAGPSTIDLALGALGLVASVVIAIWPRWLGARPWRPALRAACVIWLVGWFPISHLAVPLQMVFVADRYLLFPTLGLALALATAASQIAQARLRVALVAVLVLACGLRALDAQTSWRDSRTLWERGVSSNPDDGEAWSMYAEALLEAGDRDAATRAVEAGLEHTRAPRLVLRAALLARAGGDRAREAALDREAAERGEPRAMTNLALLYQADGKLDDALAWARRSVAAAPLYPNGQRILGKLALAAQRPDEALAAFERAYTLEPREPANRFNLALALLALRRPADARPHLEACMFDPELGSRARALLATLPP